MSRLLLTVRAPPLLVSASSRPLEAAARKLGITILLRHKMTGIIRENPSSGGVLGISVTNENKTIYIRAERVSSSPQVGIAVMSTSGGYSIRGSPRNTKSRANLIRTKTPVAKSQRWQSGPRSGVLLTKAGNLAKI